MDPPWKNTKGSFHARDRLDWVLTDNARLPLVYWKKHFFFFGAPDVELHRLTWGAFSPQVVPGKTHPVFCLDLLPQGVGALVCPCSSLRPSGAASYRFIRRGCRLLHTGYEMDRNSHLVESLSFPVPRSLASRLSFKGEVPEECLMKVDPRRTGARRSEHETPSA